MSNGLAPPHSAQFDRALNHSTALEMHRRSRPAFATPSFCCAVTDQTLVHEGGLLPRRNSPAQSDSPKFDDANVVIVQPSRKRARIVDDTDDGYIKVDEDASDNDDDEDSTSSPPSCLNNLPDPLVPISSISFADRDAVNKFLRKRIHDLQQLALKAVLKQWIKSVEPRKQSKYPYVAGKYPPWWPSNIRFKEPDHLHLHGIYARLHYPTPVLTPLETALNCHLSFLASMKMTD
ncbi:hypothetical protein EJ05DRAFT_78943 [Pseudovirgaria hyperparasitica]|uniref:Subtelomeric hrmA-associated cluster protein AFUB-079030/YDR124W-like helical bundle domain-containing protein n=1 Tax=Pseudovirgaria hyperparasitica TaxID=470096 RepID=A0A6A6W111_9PEZI|nr:uncharacterized protein EJ05DRAFT_78943 [Pseudovirgaria hyperparasitica]KAF2755819.1 hypothetical protein EJ05DRAFT_78943 [Pseudovirgaria hyperparasitica]